MITKNKFLVFCLWSVACCLLSGCALTLEKTASIYQTTCANYEKLLKNNSGDDLLRLNLATFYYKLGNFYKVKDVLSSTATEKGKILLAKALVQLKEYPLALEIFDKLPKFDDEVLYFYAQAQEGQNLFTKAVETYNKIKTEQFRQLAVEKISRIGIKVEQGFPPEITDILEKHKEFIANIDKEEAVILSADENIEIKEDNTSVVTIQITKMILREKGKGLGEVEIDYDATDERVELEYARTILPSGKIVYAGRENIRDVSKYLNFPLYSNAKVFIISMPAVDIGSIIEYKAKIYANKLITQNKFSLIYSLREQYPIVSSRSCLVLSAKTKVNFKFFNTDYALGINLKPNLSQNETTKSYTWDFKEITPIIPEDNMPPVSEINPAVAISTFNSWDEIYQWWYPLFKNKINLNTETKQFTKELIKDAVSLQDKARKIYEFCAKDIRYVGVEYGASGYEPHDANIIFINRYGDCKDKATLLVAMLKEAGLAAYPVLIPTRDIYSISEDFPQVNFNHAIAAVNIDSDLIFMDATAFTTSFADLPLNDQERDTVVMFEDNYKIIRTPLLKNNQAIYETSVTINDDESASVSRQVKTEGFFASVQRLYFKYSHPQVIEDDIKARMTQISSFSRLVNYKIENVEDFTKTPTLKYEFVAQSFLNPAGNLRIIPLLNDISISAGLAGKEARKFPIDFTGIFGKKSQTKITLPVNFKPKSSPRQRNISTDWFDFKSNCIIDNNVLDFFQEFVIKKRFVGQNEYEKFKNQLEKVLYYLKEEIILEKAD